MFFNNSPLRAITTLLAFDYLFNLAIVGGGQPNDGIEEDQGGRREGSLVGTHGGIGACAVEHRHLSVVPAGARVVAQRAVSEAADTNLRPPFECGRAKCGTCSCSAHASPENARSDVSYSGLQGPGAGVMHCSAFSRVQPAQLGLQPAQPNKLASRVTAASDIARSGTSSSLPKSCSPCACTKMPSPRDTTERLWPRQYRP